MTGTLRRAELQILFHGLVVLLIGLLSGVPYGEAITRSWGAEAVRAWRFAHLGLVIAGLWLMLVAAVLHLLLLSTRKRAILAYSVVASAYGFAVALVVAAVGGVRGLDPTGPVLNALAFTANSVGALSSLIGVAVMLNGTHAALRGADKATKAGT